MESANTKQWDYNVSSLWNNGGLWWGLKYRQTDTDSDSLPTVPRRPSLSLRFGLTIFYFYIYIMLMFNLF